MKMIHNKLCTKERKKILMWKENCKNLNSNGITLIALVITIIVLLILAGVTIATLTGDNGILTKTNNAKAETTKARAKEQAQIAVMGSYDSEGKLDYKKLKENLESIGVTGIPEEKTFPLTITIEGEDIEIKEDGTVKLAFNAKKWDESATPQDVFIWKSDDSNSEEYGTVIGYTEKANNYELLKFPSRCKKVKLEYDEARYEEVSFFTSRSFVNNVREVQLPDTVKEIADYSFPGASPFPAFKSLEKINIPNDIQYIGQYEFYGCEKLNDIIIPNSVTEIRSSAFYGCKNLSNITIPESVVNIGLSAFYDTAWYNNQPNGVVYAGKIVYKYKGEMPDDTVIEIKEGTKSISESAFYQCTNLINISIPNTVTCIKSGVFEKCSNLRNVVISDSITSIGDYAFQDCTSLKEFVIPNSVTSIGSQAFCGCFDSSSVTIPKSVITIGRAAFNGAGLTVTVNCEVDSKPSGWVVDWVINGVDVNWGYTGE